LWAKRERFFICGVLCVRTRRSEPAIIAPIPEPDDLRSSNIALLTDVKCRFPSGTEAQSICYLSRNL
jgi:hypothetical protein